MASFVAASRPGWRLLTKLDHCGAARLVGVVRLIAWPGAQATVEQGFDAFARHPGHGATEERELGVHLWIAADPVPSDSTVLKVQLRYDAIGCATDGTPPVCVARPATHTYRTHLGEPVVVGPVFEQIRARDGDQAGLFVIVILDEVPFPMSISPPPIELLRHFGRWDITRTRSWEP